MSEDVLINDGDLPPAGHSDTTPPTAEQHHGFLEQFEAFSHDSFERLKSVAEAGLVTAEAMILFRVGIKLLTMAAPHLKEEDISPEAKAELETLINELMAFDSPIHNP